MQVSVSTNNTSNVSNASIIMCPDNVTFNRNVLWLMGPAVASGAPAMVFCMAAIVFLINDLKENATLVKKLVLCLIVTDQMGILAVFAKVIYTYFKEQDQTSPALCTLTAFPISYFLLLSGAIATTMSVERCCALRAPYWYTRNMMGNQIFVPLAVVALGLLVVCLLPWLGYGVTFQKRMSGNTVLYICGYFPDEQVVISREAIFSLTFGVIVTVMVVLNVSCNVLVMQTMRKMKRVIPWHSEIQRPKEEFVMTKMLMSLSVAFLVCFTPIVVQVVLTQAGVDFPVPLKIFFRAISACHHIVDPCVYLFVNKKYRQKFRTICCPLKVR